jgi:hypothetical protein
MSEASAIVENAKDYADSATADALSKVELEVSKVSDLAGELEWALDIPVTSYSLLGSKIYEVLEALKTEQPIKPSNLGSYSLGFPVDFNPVDTSVLKAHIATLINLIGTIPDRISEALTIIDLVTGKITSDLVNGGYGIDSNDETLMWERMNDRESLNANLGIEEIKKQYGAYGMPIPQGALMEALEIFLIKATDVLSTASRDITIKRADLYRTAREFAIAKGIELGKEQLGITDMKVKALVGIADAQYNALKLEIENHKEELLLFEANMKRIFDEQNLKVAIYKVDIDAWISRINAMINANEAIIRQSLNQLEADKLTLDQRIENAKAQILAFNAEVNIRTAALSGIVSVLSNKVAGALSSINTVAAQIATEP